ncbi:MAG: 1-acyl-sn-glycerol-3-phosphate acyltransferase [Crocinitomicaceae bacterium]|nr:1-acyl-sn-glycerol-3-phosphate acyltransferase [Crocinitomicaceae bacterium]
MAPLLQQLSKDSYYSNDHHIRSWLDKMSLGSSFYLYSRFFYEVYKNRKLAKTGQYSTEEWIKGSLSVMELIERCGGRFHLEGLDNIDKIQDPVIFTSNHMSMMDPLIFPGIMAHRRRINFVAKNSVVSGKFFGPIMQSRHPIALKRKDPFVDFRKVMTEGSKILKNGESLIIYPEGTRREKFEPEKFNKMGIKLAKKTNSYIVPIALKTDFWKNGKLLKDLGSINRNSTIHIKFGKPIKINGQGNTEHQLILEFIQDNLRQWSS